MEPPRGELAELTSLTYHAPLRENYVENMLDSAKEVILRKVLPRFEAARWNLPVDFLKYSHFRRIVENVEMSSSPGYPYLLNQTNNAGFFHCVNGEFDEERLRFIWDLVQEQINHRRSDPIRLFIKPEPHSEKKISNGRYRLISSVSIIDQIIDAMLFGDMNQKMIDNWPLLPTRVGWSPYYGGWKNLPYSTNQMAIDKSGWDWTVQPWLIEVVLDMRKRLCRNSTQQWEELATWRYCELFRQPTFITSGGLLLRQLKPGVMKSGCYNTLIDNSIMQTVLHAQVCTEMGIPMGFQITMGDDTLQDQLEGPVLQRYLDIMGQYCNVKICESRMDFCGFNFNINGRVEPLYKGKHAYKMLHMDNDIVQSMADSYTLMYHRSRWSGLIDSFFRRLGCEVQSRKYRDAIYG